MYLERPLCQAADGKPCPGRKIRVALL
uniref:Uncharacterized protein n=1 Tax=Anguilla anguilla TaxID=7936 RepID=A0A0E9R360_ANGAN